MTKEPNFKSEALELLDSQSSVVMTERLLDRFPLNAKEINILLDEWIPMYQQTGQLLSGKIAIQSSLPELDIIFEQSMNRVFLPGSNPISPHDEFFETVVSLCGRRGDRFPFDALYYAAKGEDFPYKMANFIYRLCCVYQQWEQESHHDDSLFTIKMPIEVPTSWMNLLDTLNADPSAVEWKEWTSRRIPLVHQMLSSVFIRVLFGVRNDHHRAKLFPKSLASSPILSRANSSNVFDAISFQLGLMDLGGTWKRLFDSNSEGLFFRAFQETLTGYCGPTLILIQTAKGEVLGYFSDVPWKTSKTWFSGGEGESFLFRLFPLWNIYRPIVEGTSLKFHQYLNLPNTRFPDCLVGCAVGGVAADEPRLHITTELEECKASSLGYMFESGSLLGSDDEWLFDIDSLEVWAVRMEEDSWQKNLEAGRLKASAKESLRKHNAKVDRLQFVDDFSSGTFMNSLYNHRDQVRGRADFVVSDSEREGYYLQDKAPSERAKLTGNGNR
jgi:hypothetical protein